MLNFNLKKSIDRWKRRNKCRNRLLRVKMSINGSKFSAPRFCHPKHAASLPLYVNIALVVGRICVEPNLGVKYQWDRYRMKNDSSFTFVVISGLVLVVIRDRWAEGWSAYTRKSLAVTVLECGTTSLAQRQDGSVRVIARTWPPIAASTEYLRGLRTRGIWFAVHTWKSWSLRTRIPAFRLLVADVS